MLSASILSVALLLFSGSSQAMPTHGVELIARAGEPNFSVPVPKLQAAIVCPTSQVKPNTVLIVPGTGEKASKFFPDNFGKLFTANGFNVCYLDTPDMSIGDMQITSEYVAFAIRSLARSTNSKIRVLSHSQGGSDVQWALTFWPSIRPSVASFVALGPAWSGTAIGGLVNEVRKALTGKAVAAVLQQATGSNFIKALQKHSGNKALVPTTSIYTATDEIVLPAESGVLNGGTNIKIQDICKVRATGHFLLVTDSVSQFFALQAFKAGGAANVKDLKEDEKKKLCDQVLPRFTGVKAGVSFTKQMLISTIKTVVTGQGNNQVAAEPALAAYAK